MLTESVRVTHVAYDKTKRCVRRDQTKSVKGMRVFIYLDLQQLTVQYKSITNICIYIVNVAHVVTILRYS